MPDDIDRLQELRDLETESLVRQARRDIPAGAPGICSDCLEPWPRIVAGRCASCRDQARR